MVNSPVVRCRDCKQEIEFGILLANGRRIPIEPSRKDFTKDPRAQHAAFEHPTTGRLMVHRLVAGEHVNLDQQQIVLAHRYACPKSPSYSPPPAAPALPGAGVFDPAAA